MFDVLTIAAIVDEYNSLLIDGRIQDILQVDERTIALEVYALRQRRWLVISADAQRARVQLTNERISGDAERVTPLLLLLRKYARGGRIVTVSQPRYERIIRVSIAKRLEADNAAEPAQVFHSDLYVELMGRRSNVMLVDADGRVMDALKRVTPEMSRVRPIRPGIAYGPPPPQDKRDPLRASPADIARVLAASSETLSRALVAGFLGVSPLIGREIAVRAGVDPDTPAAALDSEQVESLQHALRAVFAPLDGGGWEPTVYTHANGGADFHALRLQSLEADDTVTVTPYASISAAGEAAWQASTQAALAPQRHAVRRERLVAEIDAARERMQQRLYSLREQERRAAEAEALRAMGEAIYAWIGEIRSGQAELRTPDGLVIALDASLNASQNAQEYFERYRKARAAEEHLPALIEATARQLQYLDQLRLEARLAETYDEIELVRLDWRAWSEEHMGASRAARPRGARPSQQARRPRAYRAPGGEAVLVGRTGQQNDLVTFEVAGPGDLWLHARNMPGAHVILRVTPRTTEETIQHAASLAAWYSDGRQATSVPVDVTERRHVRKIKGAGPGMVTYRYERTLNVRPRSEQELGLEPTGSHPSS